MNYSRYKFLIEEYKAGKIPREEFCKRWAALQKIDEVMQKYNK